MIQNATRTEARKNKTTHPTLTPTRLELVIALERVRKSSFRVD